MSHDMPANGLLVVPAKHAGSVYLRHHLVGDDYSDAKLISNSLQCAQKLGQVHLSDRQLAPSRVVSSVQIRR